MADNDSTARFCPKCKAETKRYAKGACKACAKARDAAYYAANRDQAIASRAAYRAANPEKWRAYAAAYRVANSAKVRAAIAAYRAANPDKVRASAAAWQADNLEARRIIQQNRAARQRDSGGSLSKGLSAKLFKLQKGKCPCCKQPLGKDYHLDHVMPIALGGANIDSNMQLLRRQCNQQKHAKNPVDFMQERGFLL